MRCSLLAGAVAACMLGCSGEALQRPPAPPVDWASLDAHPVGAADAGPATATAKERAAATAYLAALSAPDFSKLAPLLDDDAHFAFAGYKDVHGRDLVLHAHDALLGGFEGRTFAASRVLGTESSQAVEWTMTGTHKATKKPVAFRGLTLLWTRDDGSISDVHLYFDEAVPNAQVGLAPKGMPVPPLAPLPTAPPERVEAAGKEGAANVAVVSAALDALEAGDENAYAAAVADDVEIWGLESAEPLRGAASARAYFRATRKAIAQLDSQIDNAWGMGTYAVVEYHVVGEQRGSLGWVPAQKDTLLKMFVVDVAEIRGGKIARLWRYDNRAQLVASHAEVHG